MYLRPVQQLRKSDRLAVVAFTGCTLPLSYGKVYLSMRHLRIVSAVALSHRTSEVLYTLVFCAFATYENKVKTVCTQLGRA